ERHGRCDAVGFRRHHGAHHEVHGERLEHCRPEQRLHVDAHPVNTRLPIGITGGGLACDLERERITGISLAGGADRRYRFVNVVEASQEVDVLAVPRVDYASEDRDPALEDPRLVLEDTSKEAGVDKLALELAGLVARVLRGVPGSILD